MAPNMIRRKISKIKPLLNIPENDVRPAELSEARYTTNKTITADIDRTHNKITG